MDPQAINNGYEGLVVLLWFITAANIIAREWTA